MKSLAYHFLITFVSIIVSFLIFYIALGISNPIVIIGVGLVLSIVYEIFRLKIFKKV